MPAGKFKKQKHQSYICAKLLGCEKKVVIGIVPPGAGKTWVIANLEMFYLSIEGIKVIINTSEPLLE